ncbi:hypothetical protein [Pseudomonas bohemica]|uniref:hypothetical protein n=1 Tax=Pseudomonas bohemica TaxID=2044872 RepID=UPI000DA6053C|nr:hypothetical protein [Pseudomonas bohemica]
MLIMEGGRAPGLSAASIDLAARQVENEQQAVNNFATLHRAGMVKKESDSSEKNANSVYALRDLLGAIAENPQRFSGDQDLLKALKSQGALAKLQYRFEYAGVMANKEAMSTNTLKTYAEKLLPGGFQVLDELRLNAITALASTLEQGKPSNKRTKYGLLQRTEEHEEQIAQMERINFALLQGLMSAMQALRNLETAQNLSSAQVEAKEVIRVLNSIVGMNPPPFGELRTPSPEASASST